MKNKTEVGYDLVGHSIQQDELFVFQHNPRANNGIFSIVDIVDIDNGEVQREVIFTNVSKEEFADDMDNITKEYERVTV